MAGRKADSGPKVAGAHRRKGNSVPVSAPKAPRKEAAVSAGGAAQRQRMPAGTRPSRIVEEACHFFAEQGFAASTRALAARLGVTQALLYRYFPTKAALIDRVFETVFVERWDARWGALLLDRALPLETRIARFYQAYAAGISYISMRLFVRAGLDGLDLAKRYSFPLTERVLRPIVGELRKAARLPSFEDVAMLRGERELAMMLHGAIMFLGIRRYVYGMPVAEDLDTLIAMHVSTFLPGALITMRQMHKAEAPESFTVPVIDRQKGRR